MSTSVTLNVVKGNNGETQAFTIQTENKSFINSIVQVKENNSITESDMTKLQAVAKRAGDAGILELEDFNADEKLNLANMKNYGQMYEITLSEDKKYFKVKVKECLKNPLLSDIKADFGLEDGVLVKSGAIPHNNAALINARISTSNVYKENNLDYDAVKLEPGDVINIPVDQIKSLDGARGFWGRLFKS